MVYIVKFKKMIFLKIHYWQAEELNDRPCKYGAAMLIRM
jgi:hypothetical protein